MAENGILFTGHMIDKQNREHPRFPSEKETAVRHAILKELQEIKASTKGSIIAIAGAACGGDILFHEVCIEQNILSEIYLAFPVEEFKKRSVSFAGRNWENRYDYLIETLAVHILPNEKYNKTDSIFATANHWMIENAFQQSQKNITLLALWDGQPGDGDGGTEEMMYSVKDKGGKIRIIDINKI